MHVTAKEVAALAGVSITTVSLVLNNRPSRIAPATKERVWAAAKQLNFRVDRRAASLVTNTMGTIGIIVPDLQNMFFASICAACEREARAHSYSVLFGSSEDSPELHNEYIDVFSSKGVDGLILVKAAYTNPQTEQAFQEKMQQTNIPFVTVDRRTKMECNRSIMVNHRLGANLATRHLLELGHTKIGCITGPLQDYVSLERLAGYKQALAEHNTCFNPNLICEGNYRMESGTRCLPTLLGKGVSAIFCFNDMMAFGVYKGCLNYNLSIPQDLSVVGFDDIPMCDMLEVPLTSVNQPTRQIGKEATRQLFNLLHQREQARDVLFEPTLMVRGSTKRMEYR